MINVTKLAQGVVKRERAALARAITLVESRRPEHMKRAVDMLEKISVLRKEVNSVSTKPTFRLGIAGPPGAGKSTLVEALGMHLVEELDLDVAVIAIDPSSTKTGGSILGDKTRMNELSKCKKAFVRPSPTRGTLGGVAQHTNEVVSLCEAAGFDVVIVETVGLGQSEVQVDDTVDMLMLVVPPAGGDELQGVKKGIMEVCDLLCVNKADGELENSAKHACVEYMHALQLMRRKRKDWKPKVKRVSALHKIGIDALWRQCELFRLNRPLVEQRIAQNKLWMWSEAKVDVWKRMEPLLKLKASKYETKLEKMQTTPRHAAAELVEEAFAELSGGGVKS